MNFCLENESFPFKITYCSAAGKFSSIAIGHRLYADQMSTCRLKHDGRVHCRFMNGISGVKATSSF